MAKARSTSLVNCSTVNEIMCGPARARAPLEVSFRVPCPRDLGAISARSRRDLACIHTEPLEVKDLVRLLQPIIGERERVETAL